MRSQCAWSSKLVHTSTCIIYYIRSLWALQRYTHICSLQPFISCSESSCSKLLTEMSMSLLSSKLMTIYSLHVVEQSGICSIEMSCAISLTLNSHDHIHSSQLLKDLDGDTNKKSGIENKSDIYTVLITIRLNCCSIAYTYLWTILHLSKARHAHHHALVPPTSLSFTVIWISSSSSCTASGDVRRSFTRTCDAFSSLCLFTNHLHKSMFVDKKKKKAILNRT